MSTVSVKGYDRRKPEKKPDPFQSIIEAGRDRQRKPRIWIPESEITGAAFHDRAGLSNA